MGPGCVKKWGCLRLYRAEWVLDSLTRCTHLIRVPVEPRLHYTHNSGAKSNVAGCPSWV